MDTGLPLKPIVRFEHGTGPFRRAGDTVRAEPLLWMTAECGLSSSLDTAHAVAQFVPRRLLRVYSADLSTEYPLEGFRLNGCHITATRTQGLPVFTREMLEPRRNTDLKFGAHRAGDRYFRYAPGPYFHRMQVCIDYEADDGWDGPLPPDQSACLPRLAARLAAGEPVRIALVGDSISSGYDVSGETGVPPFQPAWHNLFADALQRTSRSQVRLLNFAQGGMTAAWGVEQAGAIAASQPDLLLVAFGMNDISEGLSAEAFAVRLGDLVARVRESSAQTEVLFVIGMDPHEDWTLAFPQVRAQAREAVIGLAGQTAGAGYCDVRSIWNHVIGRKGFWSMTGNGINHPNDYGHRIYADCLQLSLGQPLMH